LPDGVSPVLGKDLEHEKPVHGRARSVKEGDEAAALQKKKDIFKACCHFFELKWVNMLRGRKKKLHDKMKSL
jgi:hypothetical protein